MSDKLTQCGCCFCEDKAEKMLAKVNKLVKPPSGTPKLELPNNPTYLRGQILLLKETVSTVETRSLELNLEIKRFKAEIALCHERMQRMFWLINNEGEYHSAALNDVKTWFKDGKVKTDIKVKCIHDWHYILDDPDNDFNYECLKCGVITENIDRIKTDTEPVERTCECAIPCHDGSYHCSNCRLKIVPDFEPAEKTCECFIRETYCRDGKQSTFCAYCGKITTQDVVGDITNE